MRRFKIDKLIRDGMPESMRLRGFRFEENMMDDSEYRKRLEDKLLEEAIEVQTATNRQDRIIELGDLMEVIECLCEIDDIDFNEVRNAQKEKREHRGSFRKKISVTHIDIPQEHPEIEYFESQPERYPELVISTRSE